MIALMEVVLEQQFMKIIAMMFVWCDFAQKRRIHLGQILRSPYNRGPFTNDS
jgi:hypothetical protein